MFQLRVLALIVIAYRVCSFSSAYFVGKWTKDIDPREYFSKNLGATNAFRVLGPLLGSTVLAFDIEKAALIMFFALSILGQGEHFWLLTVMLAAIGGHMFPSYLHPHRGGKGIAVGAGCLLVLMPKVLLILLVLFLFVLACSRVISLSSLTISAVYPFLVYHYYSQDTRTMVIAVGMALLVWLMHRGNIARMLKGEENYIGKKPA